MKLEGLEHGLILKLFPFPVWTVESKLNCSEFLQLVFIFSSLDFELWLVIAISDWYFKKPLLDGSQNSVFAFRGRDGYSGFGTFE